jgi:hypothetical protein
MTMSEKIQAGTYKGRGVAGSAQMGMTQNGADQIAIDLHIPELGRVLTTFLFFTDAAKPYSIDRLRALGWDETSDDPSLPGIDRNEVDVVVKYETYKGEEKMKVEILTGGGKVTLKEQMTDSQKRSFMSALKSAAKQAGGAPAPKAPAGAPGGGGGYAL